jgi:heavy metal efflux system protein
MGASSFEESELSFETADELNFRPVSINTTLLREAAMRLPQVQAAQSRVERAESLLRLEQARVRPDITWGGEFENTQRAMKRLYVVVPLALLIFLLLYSTFNSFRYAALIIANVPFALVGGVAAVWLRGFNLSLSTAVGFIALFGVAVLNGVVMVSHINGLSEGGLELRAAVLEGAGARLRPVLMTALVASLGFVPMALSTAPGAEVQRPLATVVIGGLISSTMLTLFVLPTLYELIAEKPTRDLQPLYSNQ